MSGTLLALAGIFAELSLLAVGGGNTVIAEMHRQVVDLRGWMTAADFAALFALAQAAPGPNLMICALIGWRVAGPAGAAVAMAGIVGPSSLLAGMVWTVWQRFRDARWRIRIQQGLVPVTVGLICAGSLLVARSADTSWLLAAITAAVVAAALAVPKLHPLWLLAAGALLGVAGLG
ncbi:MAG: chromate transporter [Acidisphaera sp.]|nr:chromate transporter [Acidisphaera sp.]MBV9812400.1 chromate transporter [Acetobacteraceae bacterium]